MDSWTWCVMVVLIVAVVEWAADRVDAGVFALAMRHARKIKHQQKMRDLELEAKRRSLEATYPGPVKPVCGCTHDAAFHNKDTKLCHQEVGTGKKRHRCPCQGYSGPIPLSQVYADPLDELGGGFA